MRVIVCGGRDYSNFQYLCDTLTRLHKNLSFTLVIDGKSRGADSFAHTWAALSGIETLRFPAEWKYGKGAGPARNEQMLKEGKPDLVIAFPGGEGTADMTQRAIRAGVPVMSFQYEDDIPF